MIQKSQFLKMLNCSGFLQIRSHIQTLGHTYVQTHTGDYTLHIQTHTEQVPTCMHKQHDIYTFTPCSLHARQTAVKRSPVPVNIADFLGISNPTISPPVHGYTHYYTTVAQLNPGPPGHWPGNQLIWPWHQKLTRIT